MKRCPRNSRVSYKDSSGNIRQNPLCVKSKTRSSPRPHVRSRCRRGFRKSAAGCVQTSRATSPRKRKSSTSMSILSPSANRATIPVHSSPRPSVFVVTLDGKDIRKDEKEHKLFYYDKGRRVFKNSWSKTLNQLYNEWRLHRLSIQDIISY